MTLRGCLPGNGNLVWLRYLETYTVVWQSEVHVGSEAQVRGREPRQPAVHRDQHCLTVKAKFILYA